MKKQNIIFIVSMFVIVTIGSLTLVREQKEISQLENRGLNKFEHLTINSYLNGSFQSNLESAMEDQFIGGETIKIVFNGILKLFNYSKIPQKICKNRYVKFSNSYSNYNCGDYLLYNFYYPTTDTTEKLKDVIDNYNTINKHVDTYYYFIPTSQILDFENNKTSIDVIKILQENLKNQKAFDFLKINSYDEYTKYFYKTDHHWNHVGTYIAYKDIINMFNKKFELLEPVEEIVFDDIIFYGSMARYSQILDYKEKFTVYRYDMPDMDIISNRNSEGYGTEENYYKGIYFKEKFSNHYGLYYGEDYAEVSIEANSGKRNLLIIGNSYSNSVNKLIATHFNKTYDVDLRHYESTFNENFDIKKYVKEHNIHKILFIMDYSFLTDKNFDIRWED